MGDCTNSTTVCECADEAVPADLTELCRILGLAIDSVPRCDPAARTELALAECERRLGMGSGLATVGGDPEQATRVRERRLLRVLVRQAVELARDAETFRALGELCHSINNPLTALIGRAQLLGMSHGEDAQLRKAIESIGQSTDRVANEVREVATLVRAARDRLSAAD